MSDTMFFGVLQMPYEMAMSGEISRIQFYGRVQEAVKRIHELTDLVAAQIESISLKDAEIAAAQASIDRLEASLKHLQADSGASPRWEAILRAYNPAISDASLAAVLDAIRRADIPVCTGIYEWLSKVTTTGTPEAQHAAEVLKAWYEGADLPVKITQARFNEKMDELDAENPVPLARLMATLPSKPAGKGT